MTKQAVKCLIPQIRGWFLQGCSANESDGSIFMVTISFSFFQAHWSSKYMNWALKISGTQMSGKKSGNEKNCNVGKIQFSDVRHYYICTYNLTVIIEKLMSWSLIVEFLAHLSTVIIVSFSDWPVSVVPCPWCVVNISS